MIQNLVEFSGKREKGRGRNCCGLRFNKNRLKISPEHKTELE